MINEAADGR